MAKENERVTFEKIKNGYIVTHSWESTAKNHAIDFITEKEYFKKPLETSNRINELNKKIINKA